MLEKSKIPSFSRVLIFEFWTVFDSFVPSVGHLLFVRKYENSDFLGSNRPFKLVFAVIFHRQKFFYLSMVSLGLSFEIIKFKKKIPWRHRLVLWRTLS